MTREHGTRSKYVIEKCRCDDCRAANRNYQAQRARRVTPATVGAARARRHMIELQNQGIGYKTVADAAGIGRSTAFKIMRGGVTQIRPDTERAILGVSARNASGGNYVDAGPTWEIINKLLALGWSKAAISRAIGGGGRALQLSRHRIRVASARAVEQLWETQRHNAPPEEHRTTAEPPPFWEGDTDWMKRGACRSPEVPTWLFFAGRGDVATIESAKAICATCGVRDQCLQYALRNRAVGVWGGTSGADRRGMKPAAVECIACGGLFPHDRSGRRHCADCYSAYRLSRKHRWYHEVGKFREEAS